jgi:predicted phosphodiesterase
VPEAPDRSLRATTVAVLSDVHGNATALEAVLAELERERPDLVVFGGDLTWGPEPAETLALVQAMDVPTAFVRGNAERVVAECTERTARGEGGSLTPRARWMVERHDEAARAFLAGFAGSVVVEVETLGAVRVCHGSPRSDEEIVTPATPQARVREFMEGVPECVLVTAHTHLQFDREVAGIRSLNAGSVGMPYAEERGAYWALLGPDVSLRRTEYDLDEAARRYRATDDPLKEEMVSLLFSAPAPEELIAHGEAVVFSG